MRLIDAESTKKLAQKHLIDPYHIVSACAVIDKAETVDAVPVVRCRECKKSSFDGKYGKRWCNRDWNCTLVNDDDFCSWGERR